MATSLTRRTFLKGSGLAAAGTALAGTLAACSPGGDMQNLETDQNEKKETKLSVTGDEYFCTCSWSCSFCQYNI